MKKSRYSEEQIAFALRQAEGGTPVAEVCQMGVSEASFLPAPSYASVRRLRRNIL